MRRLGVLIALLAGLMAVQTAQAQDAFPSRPIRLIVPYPAGGTTDIMARALQQPMQDILGKPLVIENKPGAAAVIGTREVATSPPDGYNLAFVNNGIDIAPYLQKDAGFDPLTSFTPISLVATAPLVLVVHPSVPGNDIKSLIDYAKSKPDGLLYGSAGPGSLGHLSTELFAERAGIKLNHVPYKGQAPSTMGALAGEVSILLSSATATTYDYAKEGKLKILGVSSAKPSVVVPGVRPMGESLPGFEVNVWFGIVGPAGIPAPVVEKLRAALAKTLSDPALKERFLAFGVEATSSTSAELGAIMTKEAPEWKKVIEARNIKAE